MFSQCLLVHLEYGTLHLHGHGDPIILKEFAVDLKRMIFICNESLIKNCFIEINVAIKICQRAP